MAPLTVGRKAPDFALPVDDGSTFRLSARRGAPVVLYFYPEDDTEGCTIENLEFSQLMPQFRALGVSVLGISPDTVEKHCRFRDKHGLAVQLAADPTHRVLKAYGAWGPKRLFGHTYDGVIRSTVLVGPDGRVAGLWKVTRIKGHAGTVLAAVQPLAAA